MQNVRTRGTATRHRLIEAAERLFAENGFAATSVRAITGEAGVNLASLHYHFGSKDDLIAAVFKRRLEPINRARLVLLDALQAGGRLTPEGIVRAFVQPALAELQKDSVGGPTFIRLMSRAWTEPGEFFERLVAVHFKEVFFRFTQALQDTLPEVSPNQVIWRMHFTVGAMSHTAHLLARFRCGSADHFGFCGPSPADVDRVTDELVRYCSQGFRT